MRVKPAFSFTSRVIAAATASEQSRVDKSAVGDNMRAARAVCQAPTPYR